MLARLHERSLLTLLPLSTEQRSSSRTPGGKPTEKLSSLISENDVAIFVGLGLANVQRAGVRVEIHYTQSNQFAVTCPRLQRRLH